MVSHEDSMISGIAGARRRGFEYVPVFLKVWAELIAVFVTATLAAYVYHVLMHGGSFPLTLYIPQAAILAFGFAAVSAARQDYEATSSLSTYHASQRRILSFSVAFSVLVCGLFVFKLSELYSRGALIMQYMLVAGAVVGAELCLRRAIASGILSGIAARRRTLLVGALEHIRELEPGWGNRAADIDLVILPDDYPVSHGNAVVRIRETCRAMRPDDVVLAAPIDAGSFIDEVAESLSQLPVSLHLIPLSAGRWLAAPVSAQIDNLTTLQIARPPLSQIDIAVKRSFDLIVGSALIVFLLPVLAIAALAIRLDSPGPVIFRQRRHGFFNTPFVIYKLRTMTTLEDGDHIPQARRNDPRITRVGRFLRRWNIDELPQLFNVLKGDMSLVGPRPHALAHNDHYAELLSHYARRHKVKPGITGWAQVNGLRGESDTLDKMSRRVEFDLHYIENWSLAFDIRILLMTVLFPSAYRNAV